MKHLLATVLAFTLTACSSIANQPEPPAVESPPVAEIKSPETRKLIESAINQTRITRGYTQDYMVIGYPNGDPPSNTGACTDVVIRSFRSAGID